MHRTQLVLGLAALALLSACSRPPRVASRSSTPDPNAVRYRIPLAGSQLSGDANAKVTLVVFSDYECPYCARADQMLGALEREYGASLRISARQFPLPQHAQARLAAQAALAAGEQGKFWPMHHMLFEHRRELARADLERYAGALGLDLPRFRATLDRGAVDAQIAADLELARRLQVGGTPTLYINGRPVAMPSPENLRSMIDEEIGAAQALTTAGVAPSQVYDTLTAHAAEAPPPPPPVAVAQDVTFQVPVDDAYQRGDRTAPVTLVVYSDYQCPVCARQLPVLEQLLERRRDVRLVVKDHPLALHKDAARLAEIARAAGEQGKFWPMHRALLAHTSALAPADAEQLAREQGLDLRRFRAALRDHRAAASIARDAAEAVRLGAVGTPALFVNGRQYAGFVALEQLERLVEAARSEALARIAQGVAPERVYDALTEHGARRLPPRPGELDPESLYPVAAAGAPTHGRADAKVTLVVWSDFECPYCLKLEPLLRRAEQTYGRKLRVAWRNLPLESLHANAMTAAEAALAAGEQGKFWPMHDALFAHQKQLDRPSIEGYARELGLDVARFAQALDEHRHRRAIDADLAAAAKLGVRGTPTMFVGGRPLVGLTSWETLSASIERALGEPRVRDVAAAGGG
jgi:protein-disulfide isomerase